MQIAMALIKPPSALDFSNSQEQWPEWIRRFERYRQASGLDEKTAKKQVDTLIYIMGEDAEKVYLQLDVKKPTEDELKDKPNLLYDNTVQAFAEYFNPQSNALHYAILLSSYEQQRGQTNEEFIRELYEIAKKCYFKPEEEKTLIKMRLLAGMSDKALSRELQMDPNVTVDTIKSQMRAKEIILRNQINEIKEKAVDVVRPTYNYQRPMGKQYVTSGDIPHQHNPKDIKKAWNGST